MYIFFSPPSKNCDRSGGRWRPAGLRRRRSGSSVAAAPRETTGRDDGGGACFAGSVAPRVSALTAPFPPFWGELLKK